tara:strand:- start:150 stop:443 length:294 start_codon:yes stop_codon:yes gene_type:complete
LADLLEDWVVGAGRLAAIWIGGGSRLAATFLVLLENVEEQVVQLLQLVIGCFVELVGGWVGVARWRLLLISCELLLLLLVLLLLWLLSWLVVLESAD